MNPASRPRFTNLDGSSPQTLSSVLKWALLDKVLGKRRKSPMRAAIAHHAVHLDSVDRPPTEGQGARLTWLGHASWLVQLDGISLLVDPVFSDSLGLGIRRNIPCPLRPNELPPIHAQLVTHNHRDHLDLPSIRVVRSPVVCGLGTRLPAEQPSTELGWWNSTTIGTVRVTFVPSQHWSRRGLWDANHSLWGGFVIEGSSACLYHAGDTAYFDGFVEIQRRFPTIDAAMLPIGAYDPAWFMEKQHMNPEQAVQAWVDLQAHHFLAMHWGTFKLTDEPLDEPPLRLATEWERRGFDPTSLHVIATGDSWDVNQPNASRL